VNRLDDEATYALDASGMFGHIESLGAEFEAAWAASRTMELPPGRPVSLTVAGMGGSASAADYFEALTAPSAAVPIAIVKDYSLPRHVGPGSLVVIVSYSGTTEEAISCFDEAVSRGCQTLAITTGGELAAKAEAAGQPFHRIAYEAPPRAALGHMLAPLLRLAATAGAVPFGDAAVAAAVGNHRRLVEQKLGISLPAAANPAKRIAHSMTIGSTPVVFAAQHLVAAGRRAKNQFAENAKTLAVFEEVPEATHNTIVSLEATNGPVQLGIAFDSPLLSSGNRRRLDVTSRLFEERGFAFHHIKLSGDAPLSDLLEATAYADFISCYLAMMRGLDPTPTSNLTRMRTAVASAPTVA
jgi:glucose/mannose-6-phosphate isomerase